MIEMNPVAYVHNNRSAVEDDYWGNMESEIRLTDEFDSAALDGIEEFSHLEILFYFDKVPDDKIKRSSHHPRNNKLWPKTGIFAQRGKNRPNKIGLTIVELVSKDGKSLFVKRLDAIDGTPVLDIKPVIKEFLPVGEILQPMWASELMENYWK